MILLLRILYFSFNDNLESLIHLGQFVAIMVLKHALDAHAYVARDAEILNRAPWMSYTLRKVLILRLLNGVKDLGFLKRFIFWAGYHLHTRLKVSNRKAFER